MVSLCILCLLIKSPYNSSPFSLDKYTICVYLVGCSSIVLQRVAILYLSVAGIILSKVEFYVCVASN